MNTHELWTVLHGMVFGFLFLLGFTGALYGIYVMKPEWMTEEGTKKNVRIIQVFLWVLTAAVWLAVFSGAFVVYPWYRAVPPEGATDLTNFPKFLLLANASTAFWHNFGMEWKEHIAFVAPFAATMVAFMGQYYGAELAKKPIVRRYVMIFFTIAFAAAGIAGMFGAFITKAAAVH
jgi:hypothetical protein